MDTDTTAGVSTTELAAAFIATGPNDTYTSVINTAGDVITVIVVDAASAKTVEAATLTFTVKGKAEGNNVLPVQSYTVDTTIKYETSSSVAKTKAVQTGANLGAWTLNVAQAVFAYVPVNFVGAVTSQFEVGNKGVVDGEITLSGFDTAGNDYSAVLPFTAQAGKLTKIGDDDIAKAFGLTKGTKLNLTITVNAPASAITFGGYSNRGNTGRMSLQKTK